MNRPLFILCFALSCFLAPSCAVAEGATRLNERSKQGGDLAWGYVKDEVVQKGHKTARLFYWVKDSKGHKFKFIPKGPRLPMGASPGVVKAHAKRHGWKMIPIGKEGAKAMADFANKWELLKFGNDLYNIYADEEITDEEAQNQVIATTIVTEIGLGVGHLISAAGGGTGAGLVAAWALDEVKTAYIEYLSMWDAIDEAKKKRQEAHDHPLYLGQRKLYQIKAALDAGDFKQAEKYTENLRKFAYKYEFVNADPRMGKLYDISLKLKKKIKKIKAEAKQRKIDEFNAKIRAWEDKEEARRREEAGEQAAFSVSVSGPKGSLEVGEAYSITITPRTGTPPFWFSGDVSYSRPDREPVKLDFPGIGSSGSYGFDVVAYDSEGRRRLAHETILVKGEEIPDSPDALIADVASAAAKAAKEAMERKENGVILEYWTDRNEYHKFEFKVWDGIKEGMETWYNPEGESIKEIEWHDGKKDGWESWIRRLGANNYIEYLSIRWDKGKKTREIRRALDDEGNEYEISNKSW
ncbi:hypothetical protein ACFL2T_04415 [Elusimicrobiota bacterium]